MKQRIWAVALAAVMFLAGVAASSLWHGAKSGGSAVSEPLAERFVEEFQLSPERSKLYRKLLHYHLLEMQRIKDQYHSAQNTKLGEELAAESRSFKALIRDTVLPLKQREEFDRLLANTSQPLPPQ